MTFFGWNTSKDGTGTTYQPRETVTIGKTVETTYYAVWVGTPSPESTFIVTDVESLIYYSAFPDITVIVGNTGLTPNQLVLTEDLHIADGTIIRMLDEELNSAGINPNGFSIIKDGSGESRIKIFAEGDTSSLYQLYLDGEYTITNVSSDIILDTTGLSGENSVITRSGSLRLTGQLDAGITFSIGNRYAGNPEPTVVLDDLIITENSIVTLAPGTSSVDVTYVVEGDVELYGSLVKSDDRGAIPVSVADDSVFLAYPGSSIDTVAVRPIEGSSTAVADTGDADVDLGVYIGGENYSNIHETYSGMDTTLLDSTPSEYYLSMGAEVHLNEDGIRSFYVTDGYIGLSWMTDGSVSGIVDRHGSSTIHSKSPSGELLLTFICEAETVNITFVSNGDVCETQIVDKGSFAVPPNEPELYGYVFSGWFLDDGTFLDEFDFTEPITSNITLYAKWDGNLQFTTDPISDGHIEAIDGLPGTVSFSASPSSYYASVLWDFGDGTSSTNLYATHYYGQPGVYHATLTVFNNHGSDTTEFIIEVPEIGAGGGGNDLFLWVAAGLALVIAGGLVVRRLL